jgi:hypothetical protein
MQDAEGLDIDIGDDSVEDDEDSTSSNEDAGDPSKLEDIDAAHAEHDDTIRLHHVSQLEHSVWSPCELLFSEQDDDHCTHLVRCDNDHHIVSTAGLEQWLEDGWEPSTCSLCKQMHLNGDGVCPGCNEPSKTSGLTCPWCSQSLDRNKDVDAGVMQEFVEDHAVRLYAQWEAREKVKQGQSEDAAMNVALEVVENHQLEPHVSMMDVDDAELEGTDFALAHQGMTGRMQGAFMTLRDNIDQEVMTGAELLSIAKSQGIQLLGSEQAAFGWARLGERTWLGLKDEEGRVLIAWQVAGKPSDDDEASMAKALLQSSCSFRSFVTGCAKGYVATCISAGHVSCIRSVCNGIRDACHGSLEILRKLLDFDRHFDSNTFNQHIAPHLRGYVWSLEQVVSNNWQSTLLHVSNYLDSTAEAYAPSNANCLWLCGCDTDVFLRMWAKCTEGQQMEFREPPEILDALVAVLCTLRETDFQSLDVALRAMRKIREFGGIKRCVIACLAETQCSGKCNLAEALSHTFKQSEETGCSVNVDTFRSLGKLFPEVLYESHLTDFEPWADWLRRHREVILSEITGVGEVVFVKLLSLMMVGVHFAHESLEAAWDTRVSGIRLGIPMRAKSTVHGDKYGYPEWVDYMAFVREYTRGGLMELADTAADLHSSLHKQLKYSINARRSKVASYLQAKYPTMLKEMCEYHNVEPLMANMTGLRECLRFVYMLASLQHEAFNHPRRLMKNRVPAHKISEEHTIEFFERIGLQPQPLYRSNDGQIFGRMNQLLHPRDTAYWWDHAGALVLLVGVQELEKLCACPTIGETTIYTGNTEWKSYQAAAAHTTCLQDLFDKVSREELWVCSWSWNPLNSFGKDAHVEWDFDLQKIGKTSQNESRTVNIRSSNEVRAKEASENLLGQPVPPAWSKVGFMMPEALKRNAAGKCYYASCKMPAVLTQMLDESIDKLRKDWSRVFKNEEVKSTDRQIGLLGEEEFAPFREQVQLLLPQLGGLFEPDASILQGTLIRITPLGTVAAAMKRAQILHRDTNQTIFDEAGEVHSVFCVQYARVIRVTELQTGETRLLVLEGGVAHALHGRWRHSGWCLPKKSSKRAWRPNVCLFMYVARSVVQAMTRKSTPMAVTWSNQQLDHVDAYYICNQSTGEVNDSLAHCSLEWPQLSTHEICNTCQRLGPIYNAPGEHARYIPISEQ